MYDAIMANGCSYIFVKTELCSEICFSLSPIFIINNKKDG